MKQLDENELKRGEIVAMDAIGDAMTSLMRVYRHMGYAESLAAQMEALEEGEHKIGLPYTKMLMLFAAELGKATESDPGFKAFLESRARAQFVQDIMGNMK